MKKLIYILSVFLISSQFLFCQSESWKVDHSEDTNVAEVNPNVNEVNPGETEENPGETEENPGETEENPGETEENPGETEENPDLEENPYLDDYNSSLNDGPVSRTSGVAPLAVHFFADFVDSASGAERIDRYHHYDYTWNFGDTGSGIWGTSGRSKNMAKGANAVHIFEEGGVYNITLTIRNHSGIVGTENYTVTVTDPDSFYNGNTVCVNRSGDNNFSGAPAGALQINSDSISTITQYAKAGNRILFKRGSSWTTAGLDWPSNAGPVTIGAYGTGVNPDALGIYENAPRITVTSGSFLPLGYKQDWRLMDIHFIDASGYTANCVSGSVNMQRQLLLRLKVEGFSSGIGWSHWNSTECMQKDDMVVASCDVSGSESNILYVGSERLAIIGNILSDARDSHVVRVWQGYRSIISHNYISGSSIHSTSGRSALKFHGPGYYPGGEGATTLGEPVPGTSLRSAKSEYSIVSDNVFGSSGPWPVNLGPQNDGSDERLSNIIFERNRLHPDFGNSSSRLVTIAMHIWARYVTIRNNIFDGTGSSDGYWGIVVEQTGVEPAPIDVKIYNNTIYRGDAGSNIHRGVVIRATATDTIVQNNIVWFPYATGSIETILNDGSDSVISNNVLGDDPRFVAPNAADPLGRDFSLQSGSNAINTGITVPVFEDYFGSGRAAGSYDIGACEY